MNKYIEAYITVRNEALMPCPGYAVTKSDMQLKCRCNKQETCRLKKSVDLIEELVDRATPKKCEEKEQIVNGISIIHAVCPNCGIEIDEFEHFKGCPYCLQALDWSDEGC